VGLAFKFSILQHLHHHPPKNEPLLFFANRSHIKMLLIVGCNCLAQKHAFHHSDSTTGQLCGQVTETAASPPMPHLPCLNSQDLPETTIDAVPREVRAPGGSLCVCVLVTVFNASSTLPDFSSVPFNLAFLCIGGLPTENEAAVFKPKHQPHHNTGCEKNDGNSTASKKASRPT